MVRYRGYLIRRIIHELTGTSRVVRPDGSWRACLPTLVDGATIEWQVFEEIEPGIFKRAGMAVSEEDARKLVDKLRAAASGDSDGPD